MSGDVALEASAIVKRFKKRLVLDGAEMILCRGEAVGLVGENGAGKTSLLRICAGLLDPDRGSVQRRGRIGYCPQHPALFELLTASEHLVLFGRALGLDQMAALHQGGAILAELGFREPDTLAKALSGGSSQKIKLTLALLGNPDVLLLDEPYQGFDHGTYVDFWDLIDGWRAHGIAVAVVTHMLPELWRVDRVVELTAPRGLVEAA
jgi:ABC-2 type transport system ATP-binding protein